MSLCAIAFAFTLQVPAQVAPPPIEVDSSAAPDLYVYATKLQALMGVWYSKSLQALEQKPDPYQHKITIRIRADHPPEISWLAYASGDTITVFADYARNSPNDIGVIVHELVHVLQRYPSTPGWLVEGIADYVRWHVYEPQPRPEREDLRGRNYTDGYQTTASFLAWTQDRYDRHLVARLNAYAKAGPFNVKIFKNYTGKSVDDLWTEYVKSRLEGK